ncbi:MAG: cytochrome P450, partial [Acidimicrobiales bacterium]
MPEDLTAPLLDPEIYTTNPHPDFARLRAEAPVAWNQKVGFWAITKHADVSSISKDHETFCSAKGILLFEIGAEYRTPPTMMHTDPPDHTRYRKLVQPGFKPSFIRGLEPSVRRRAKALVEKIEPGQPVDLVQEVSVPLPLQIISDLLGVPGEDWERFLEWSEAAIPGATDWPEEKRNALHREMVEYLLATTSARRASPREDIISELAQARVDGESLTDDELAMFLVQLLVAGNETTRNMLSGGFVALADHPAQWDRLRRDPALISLAVEE